MKTMNHVNITGNVGAVMADRMMFLDSSVIWKLWCSLFCSCQL